MSGGSFNYASTQDITESGDEDQDDLVAALAEHPGCPAAAAHARAVLTEWREARRKAVEAWAALYPLLKAVEWYQSGDWGEESIDEALAELEKNGTLPPRER